ncbi:MAG: hypothetical protein ABWY19_14345 [Marmoricola sp.]
MRLLLRASAASAVVALLLSLAACGENDVDSYCSDLTSARKELAEMVNSDSASALLGNLPLLHDLADAAPEDVADEWQVFLRALDGLDQSLEDAGVEPSDFVDGKPPEGLSAADGKGIADAVAQVQSEEVVAAANGIEQQGRDVCKVNLGL